VEYATENSASDCCCVRVLQAVQRPYPEQVTTLLIIRIRGLTNQSAFCSVPLPSDPRQVAQPADTCTDP
jgi:hypothetical protein